jgi:hypothetical protein
MRTPDHEGEPRRRRLGRRGLLATTLAVTAAALWLLLPASTSAVVSGAGFTTDNPDLATGDGAGHCLNGPGGSTPSVNCNIYDGKPFVWINGGPSLGQNQLTAGTYLFAVLEPAGQANPNDGTAHNLSDTSASGGTDDSCGSPYQDREFTVSASDGKISSLLQTGTPACTYRTSSAFSSLGLMIDVFPYDTTSNPGGVYILAICQLSSSVASSPINGTVAPSSCKYDAFKVKESAPPPGQVQSCFGGIKYRDDDKSGNFTAGEATLSGWTVDISDGTNNYTATTDSNGAWSWCEPLHDPAAGTTTYTFQEQQQTGWKQTGNNVDEGIYSSNVSSNSLASFVYSVTVPNDDSATADDLDFGNIAQGVVTGGKYYDGDQSGTFNPLLESLIPGWRIAIGGSFVGTVITGSLFADANDFASNFTKTLDPGTYTFTEQQATNGWLQTGNTANQTSATGGATAALSLKAYTVTVPNDQPSSVSAVYFGNVCRVTPGGRTLGFWSNKNGQALETAADFVGLTAMNLRNANGSNRDFTGTLSQNKSALNSWLLSASATNMAYMLSAQLTATYLSVQHGFTNPNVIVDGTKTVADEIASANSLLANPIVGGTFNGQNGSSTAGASALRTEQERVKNILDKINNVGSFIQPTLTTCPTPTFP